eukprot:12412503-Karenia_brevis.AAC.1
MSAAVACSGGSSPYFALGLALPYEGGVLKQAPQGLATRGFKRACEHSELDVGDDSQEAEMLATRIFTSSESTHHTLKEVSRQGATILTHEFEQHISHMVLGPTPTPTPPTQPTTEPSAPSTTQDNATPQHDA